jgi:hypothetical protein
MGAALVAKQEKKKGKAAARPAESPEDNRWDESTGTPAGLPLFLQCNLAVGAPDDEYEREAERVADAIAGRERPTLALGRASPRIQRQCACGGTGQECEACHERRLKLQRRTSGGEQTGAATPAVNKALRSTGKSLDAPLRSTMEGHFGHDLGGVRIHTDAVAGESAQAVGALAYTVGQHVVFGANQYRPDSPSGLHLLAHELTHTVQQSRSSPTERTPVGAPGPQTAAVQRSTGNQELLARQPDPNAPVAPAVAPDDMANPPGANTPAPDPRNAAPGSPDPQPDPNVPEPFEGARLLVSRSKALEAEVQAAEFQWGKDYMSADLPWDDLIKEKLHLAALKREKLLIDTFYANFAAQALFGIAPDTPVADVIARCQAAAPDEAQTLALIEGNPAAPGDVSEVVTYLLLQSPELFPDHVIGLYRSAVEEYRALSQAEGERAEKLVEPLVSRPIEQVIPDFVWMIDNETFLRDMAVAVGFVNSLNAETPVLLEKKEPNSTQLGIDDIRVIVNEEKTDFGNRLNPLLGSQLAFLYAPLEAYYFFAFYGGMADQMELFRIAVQSTYERLNEPLSSPDVIADLQRAYGSQVSFGALPGGARFISQLAPDRMRQGYTWIAEQFEGRLDPWVNGLAWYERIWEGFGLYDVVGEMGRTLKGLISLKSILMMVGFIALMIALQFVPFGNLIADAIMIFLLGKDVIEGLFILGSYFDAASDAATFRTLYSAAQNLKGAGAVAVSLLLQLAMLGAGKALGAYLKYNRGLKLNDIDEIADDPAIKDGPPSVQKALADAKAEGKGYSEWKERLNPETQKILDDPANAALKKMWAEMDPAVRRVLTRCGSDCIPRNATPLEVAKIKGVLEKFGVNGGPTEALLKEYFHARRDVLGRAIDDLANAKDLEQLADIARESPVVPPGTPLDLAARINAFQARFKLPTAQEALLREFFEANRSDLQGALDRIESASGPNDLLKRLRVEAATRAPAAPGTPAVPKSASAYDHSLNEHGATRPAKELADRAKTKKDPATRLPGNQMGQWYNDQLVIELDQRFPNNGIGRPEIVDFGRPVGRVYLPDGRVISDVTTCSIMRYPDGTFNNAFPALPDAVFRAYYP